MKEIFPSFVNASNVFEGLEGTMLFYQSQEHIYANYYHFLLNQLLGLLCGANDDSNGKPACICLLKYYIRP